MPPDLAELVRADGIDFAPAAFVDLTGRRCAKPVAAQAVEELRDEGGGFAGQAAGARDSSHGRRNAHRPCDP
ncbi:hypothetical protein [Streptomyces sp. B21-108]|jgi:hypothetical protein|uniref:hypothetical protein n=1 Tax=Streptomyces sp. B21-108 TaxID=3039419 RepID=UPI002FF1ACFC